MTLPVQLVIHGGGGGAATIGPLIEALRPYADVRAPNLLGHAGRPIPERFSIADWAADLVAYLDREGLDRVFVTGYSIGAYIALYLARHYPGRVRGACALAGKFIVDARTVSHWTHLASEARLLRPGGRASILEKLHAPHDWRVLMSRLVDFVVDLGANPPLTEADLKAITVPVILISSNRDPIVTWDETAATGKLIPGAELVMFYGFAHPISSVPVASVAKAIDLWMGRVGAR